jgi:Skp family chaperone for outer membrane proteins
MFSLAAADITRLPANDLYQSAARRHNTAPLPARRAKVKTRNRHAARPSAKCAAVRMTSNKQGVLSVRFSLVCATFVAGPLSLCFMIAPAAAQAPPGLPPAGVRPAGQVGPAGPAFGPTSAPAPSAAPSGTNVAVIDIAHIFKNHVRFNAQMNDMKRDIDAFDASMRDESVKLQKKAESMQTFNPSSNEFKKTDEELAHLKSDFQIRVQAKKREFLEQEARVYYGIYREVEDAVASFAQRNRIGLVLRYTGDEMKPDDRSSVLQGVNKPVVYQDRLDITQHVLNQLNAGATMPPNAGGIAPPISQGPGQIQQPNRTATPVGGPTIPGATKTR